MKLLSELRELMNKEKIDTYLITKFDPHQTEYSHEYWNSVEFLSGFKGSFGTLLINNNYAGLWTDGRYYIQANQELEKDIHLQKEDSTGVISYIDYAIDQTPINGTIAFDGRTISFQQVKELLFKSKSKNIKIKNNNDLIGKIWKKRPPLSGNLVFEHDIKYCGVSREEKINQVRNEMLKYGADMYIISSLDDIAWLFNLRGSDIKNNALFYSYAVLTKTDVFLFLDKAKTKNIQNVFSENIILKNYEDIFGFCENIKVENILINPNKTSYSLYKYFENFNLIETEVDITTCLKAVKNKVEIDNLEIVNIRDGISMVKFIKDVKESVVSSILTENDVVLKSIEYRKNQTNYLHQSFDTIAGYNENGAILHYKAKEINSKIIENKGILLIDSGATYLDGTTDITRTIAVGQVSNNMKRDFTLVLKSHIALNKAVFLYGTTGSNIDILARMPMWINGIDYKSGTGHGLGFCLNVHEGPQRISKNPNKYPLEVGMVTTNEPGIYRENKYGIRTENTMIVEKNFENEFGEFLKFRVISYCPIDLELIEVDMLDEEEKNWLNDYHKTVYDKLISGLNEEEKNWLKKQTRTI